VDSRIYKLTPCKDLALYIHIPFCEHKCYYCDFFSLPGRDQPYIKKVITEIANQTDFYLGRIRPEKIASVYIGGGTPSSLPKSSFKLLLQKINLLCPAKVLEFTVEANPESLDEEFLSLCKEYGVTRLSVGIQTSSSRLRATLGRRGDVSNLHRVFGLIKDKWCGDVNYDLLCGIPGETLSDMQKDLKTVLALNPAHISLYTLTLEQGTILYQQWEDGLLPWPDRGVQDELWLQARDLLVKNGYINYEISNFALPGKECLHNVRYWLLKPYVGMGPSAVSTVPAQGGRIARLSNPQHIPRYLKGADSYWCMEVESIKQKEFLFEHLMLGFRLKNGIPKALFHKRFGKELSELIPELWRSWSERGFIKESTASYCLTLRGRLILNQLLSELSQYEIDMSGIKIQWP